MAACQVCKTTNFTEKHVLESLGDLHNETRAVVVLKKPSWDHKESNELSLLNSNDLCSLLQRAGLFIHSSVAASSNE